MPRGALVTAGDDLASVVSEQLARGAVGHVRKLDPEVPAPVTQAPHAPSREDALDARMNRPARPCIAPPAPPTFDGLTMGELRAALFDLHHRLNVVTLQRDALARRVAELEALAAGPRISDAEPAGPSARTAPTVVARIVERGGRVHVAAVGRSPGGWLVEGAIDLCEGTTERGAALLWAIAQGIEVLELHLGDEPTAQELVLDVIGCALARDGERGRRAMARYLGTEGR